MHKWALALALALPALAAAQERPAQPGARDTVRGRPEVPLPDSLSPDSFRPVLPVLGPPPGPQPSFARHVFDGDSLRWSGAQTLGELLARIPGVFLVRAGWIGQPEAIAFAGQGAASVELYWDGFRLDALGLDSSAVDVGRIPLGLLRRVEVERSPSVLRVYLVSDVQTVRRPRTETSFSTGDAATNAYLIRYLNRWRNGSGLGVGVNWFGTDGPGTSPGRVTDLTLWGKGTWTASPQVGVEYQVLSLTHRRARVAPTGAVALPTLDGRRTDAFLRAFAATRQDGMGLRFDALFGSSVFTDTTGDFERTLSQVGAVAAYRASRTSLELTSRLTDGPERLYLRGRAAWAPARSLALSVHAATGRGLDDARSVESGAFAELRPLGWLTVHGSVRTRDLRLDTSQAVTDWSAGMGLARRDAALDLTVGRHGRFRAPTWAIFATQIPSLTEGDVATLTTTLSLRPRPWLTLFGWHRHPLDPPHASFEPPHHARATITFRSQFLPYFRLGIFDVLLQAELEGWSDGVAGRDSLGSEIRLLGATHINYLVEFRLGGAVLFWTLRNPQLERFQLVPGYQIARGLQRFGVRWEFVN